MAKTTTILTIAINRCFFSCFCSPFFLHAFEKGQKKIYFICFMVVVNEFGKLHLNAKLYTVKSNTRQEKKEVN